MKLSRLLPVRYLLLVRPLGRIWYREPETERHDPRYAPAADATVFDSLTDLATEIRLVSSHYSQKPINNVTSILAQVLNGNRGVPDELETAIEYAYAKRIESLGLSMQPLMISELSGAFERQHTIVAKRTKQAKEQTEIERMVLRTEDAEHLVVVTGSSLLHPSRPPTRPGFPGVWDCFVVAQTIARAIGLHWGLIPISVQALLPDREHALQFWHELYEYLVAWSGHSKSMFDRLGKLSAQGLIRVYVVPPMLCSIGTIVCDPDDSGQVSAFSYSFVSEPPDDKASVRVLEWEHVASQSWHRNIYVPFSRGEIFKEELPWSEAKPAISGLSGA